MSFPVDDLELAGSFGSRAEGEARLFKAGGPSFTFCICFSGVTARGCRLQPVGDAIAWWIKPVEGDNPVMASSRWRRRVIRERYDVDSRGVPAQLSAKQ